MLFLNVYFLQVTNLPRRLSLFNYLYLFFLFAITLTYYSWNLLVNFGDRTWSFILCISYWHLILLYDSLFCVNIILLFIHKIFHIKYLLSIYLLYSYLSLIVQELINNIIFYYFLYYKLCDHCLLIHFH